MNARNGTTLLAMGLFLLLVLHVGVRLDAHDHDSSHTHTALQRLWTIEDVLALNPPAGAGSKEATEAKGSSGDGALSFEVRATSKDLPAKVFEQNPHGGGRTILACAHGGFAYDHRPGKGETYWFLQGGGILRISRDRSKIELVDTDPSMIEHNLHNATFYVHDGKGRIAWPANGDGRVFITDVEGKLLQTIGKPTVGPYAEDAGYAPTDTAYLDGKLWVTDGYGSKFVMSYDLNQGKWTGSIFGGRAKAAEPGKFGTNHGITIHKGLLFVAGRYFARIHRYEPDTTFVDMFPMPDGSKPCDFEFFTLGGKLYGVATSLNVSDENKKAGNTGAAIYIVDMESLKIVSTIKPKDELGLSQFTHLHGVFPVVDEGVVHLFCQSWNPGDFAILSQVTTLTPGKAAKGK